MKILLKAQVGTQKVKKAGGHESLLELNEVVSEHYGDEHKDVDVAGNRKVIKTQCRLWMVITFTDYDNSSRITDDIE